MAINKELYERYKQMKAQGINVTLAELKSQMEGENSTSPSPTPQTTYSSVSSVQTQQQTYTSPVSTQPEPVRQTSMFNSSVNNYSSSTTTQTQTYNSAPDSDWTNSYSQPLESSNDLYTGNVSYSDSSSSSYMSQFGNGTSFSQLNTTVSEKPFHGNVEQTSYEQTQPATKFGLIGYPLGHSMSTFIHNAGFKSLGYDNYTYELLETHPESLVDRIKFLKNNDYAGFNVTIPLKLPITVFLNEIDTSADIVGAVNTVVINKDKTLKGYNTDVLGFINAIPKDISLSGKTAGILGTGGAARAAIAGLISLGVDNIKIFTRNIPNSLDLLDYLEKSNPNVQFNAYQIEHIRNLSDIDILVNCTPIGMKGKGAGYTPVEEAELCTLPQSAIVYDVVYNPRKTILIKLAEKNGYRTILGLDMLIHQAVEAQKIWTGKTPDFKDMKISALENMYE